MAGRGGVGRRSELSLDRGLGEPAEIRDTTSARTSDPRRRVREPVASRELVASRPVAAARRQSPEGEREGTRPARCPARTSPGARWGAACELLLRGVAAATSRPRSGETEPLPMPAGASGSGRTLTDSLRGPSPAGCGCGSRPSARHRRRGGAPSRRGRSAGRGERSRAPPRRQRAPRTRRRR